MQQSERKRSRYIEDNLDKQQTDTEKKKAIDVSRNTSYTKGRRSGAGYSLISRDTCVGTLNYTLIEQHVGQSNNVISEGLIFSVSAAVDR